MEKIKILFFSTVVILTCGVNIQATVIDWVTVGDPGNQPDDTGFGSVNYIYQIGKYEVTNRQYCEFLNTVAAADPFGLYNPSMVSSSHGGIIRQGEMGYYTYLVKSGYANRPVVYVSRLDAMRFANWFHNGQGSGDTEDGVYELSLGENIVRKENALIWICSEDEWYKAAYYKAGSLNAGYWDYPTQSNSAPVHELPPGGTNSAHYWLSYYGPVDVGSYVLSPSAYGTFDQAGNVWEKTDTKISSGWIARGGSFATTDYALPSWHHDARGTLSGESAHAGFRVAKVSELQINMLPVACVVDGDRVVEAEAGCEGRVVLDGSCSSDADSTEGTNDDINDFDWYEVIDACEPNSDIYIGSGEVIECNLGLGEHLIVLEVTDKAGAFDSNEVVITVVDVTPPELSVVVEPNVLWPPNGKMVEVRPEWEVSDNCDEAVEVSLADITMSAAGDINDYVHIGDDGSIYLRAKRAKGKAIRVYTLTYEAVDDSGNATEASASVTVPHSRGPRKLGSGLVRRAGRQVYRGRLQRR